MEIPERYLALPVFAGTGQTIARSKVGSIYAPKESKLDMCAD